MLLVLLLPACANNSYRFERIDGDQAVSMPFQFTGITGRRDGASVRAEMSFADGADTVQITVLLELVPPAEFRSGTYRLNLGGKTVEGRVDCPSLDYLGGQNTQPSVGGVFVLTDAQNRPIYRVRVPPTLMTRKLEF